MSAPSGTKSFERGIADLECRLRFVTCRVFEWRKYGSMGDHDVCRDFRRYLCEEVEREIIADVTVCALSSRFLRTLIIIGMQLSDTLISRCEDASQRVPQTWASLRPFNIIAEKLGRHMAAGGRHLEIWRDNSVYLAADYVDEYCVEALLDLVRDEAQNLLQRTADLRAFEADLRGIIGSASSLPLRLSLPSNRPLKHDQCGASSMYGANFVSPFTSSIHHTFHAPRRVKHADP